MFKDRHGKAMPTVRKVWRMSKNAPQGEWVELDPAPPATVVRRDDLPEVSSGSWVTSSYDLLSGSQVTEDPDTVPGELFDELFAPARDTPKSSG